MYIKELAVNDYRSFSAAQFDFSPRINLIVGPNNAGKSSIINALYVLQNAGAIGNDDIRLGRDFAFIKADIEAITPVARRRYFNGKHPLEDDCQSCTITHKIIHQAQERKYIQHPASKDAFERDFHGLSAVENQHNFIYPFLSKRRVSNYAIQSSTANANAVMDTFQNLALKVQKVYSQPKTKTDYETYCQAILGFIVTPITTDGGPLSLGIYSGYTASIPIESMGDGVVNVVGLLCILLTEDDKLFLIEEPESDLHPSALKKLLQLIIAKSDRNQFIVSTHSNIVVKHLASVQEARILYTECSPFDPDHEDIPTSTVTSIGNTPQERLWVLESLGYEPFDFEIYKGYLIFEESTAERLIRDVILPQFIPEGVGILRTIAAQGVSGLEAKFEDLQNLFLYLHLAPIYQNRAWVIADGDETGKHAIDQLKSKYTTWDSSHFIHWDRPHFEEYYPSPFQEQVNKIIEMPHGKAKQQEKTNLLNAVIDWVKQDPDAGLALLEVSAAEIIGKLRTLITLLTATPTVTNGIKVSA